MRLLLAHCPRSLPITARRNAMHRFFIIPRGYANARVSPRGCAKTAALNRRTYRRYARTAVREWLNVTSRSCTTAILCLPRVSLTFLPSFRGITELRTERLKDRTVGEMQFSRDDRRDYREHGATSICPSNFFPCNFAERLYGFFFICYTSIPLLRLNAFGSFRRWYID